MILKEYLKSIGFTGDIGDVGNTDVPQLDDVVRKVGSIPGLEAEKLRLHGELSKTISKRQSQSDEIDKIVTLAGVKRDGNDKWSDETIRFINDLIVFKNDNKNIVENMPIFQPIIDAQKSEVKKILSHEKIAKSDIAKRQFALIDIDVNEPDKAIENIAKIPKIKELASIILGGEANYNVPIDNGSSDDQTGPDGNGKKGAFHSKIE